VHVLIIIAVTASNLIAADIGVIGAKTWTDDADIGDPEGLGIFVTDRVSEHFRLQLEYRYFRHEREVLGWITSQWQPVYGDPELLKSVTTYNAFDADVLVEIWRLGRFGIECGPGISMNNVSLKRISTDVNPTSDDRSVSRLGLSFTTRVSTRPVSTSPFRLNLSFKAKHIRADKTQLQDSWTPYEDGLGIYELSIGLAYIFD